MIYATTESTVLSFRLIQSTTTTTHVSSAGNITSSTLGFALRDYRPFQSNQQHAVAQFNITELELSIGCTPGCAVLTQSELDGEQQFVIANSTGVFSYVGEDKRLALGIEGEKLAVHWWFNYLITVTNENRKTPVISSSTLPTMKKPSSDILDQLTAK